MNKKKKIFIDGSAGTTGLRIYDRLSDRKDLELIILDDDKRKDNKYRRRLDFANAKIIMNAVVEEMRGEKENNL